MSILIVLLFSCVIHKTSIVGIVDTVEKNQCVIELTSGETVPITSPLCMKLNEGEEVFFYIKK